MPPVSDSLKKHMRDLLDKRSRDEISSEDFVKEAKRIKAYVESDIPEGGFKSTGNLPLDLLKGVIAPGARAAVLTGMSDPLKQEEGWDIWRSMGRGAAALATRVTRPGIGGVLMGAAGPTPPIKTPWGVPSSADEMNAAFVGLVGAGSVRGGVKAYKTWSATQRAIDLAQVAKTHVSVETVAKGLMKPPVEGWHAKWRQAYKEAKDLIDRPLEREADQGVEPPAVMAPPDGMPRPAVDLMKETAADMIEKGATQKEALSKSMAAAAGRTVALNKVEVAALRVFGNLDKLPSPLRRAWLRVANEAKSEGLIHDAMNLAEAVKAKPFPVSDKQHVSMVMKAAEIKRELSGYIDEAAKMIDAGNPTAAEIASQRADVLRKNLDLLTEAADLAGSEAGRSLSIRRMMMNMDTYDLVTVLRKAKVSKGGVLTVGDESRFKALVKNNDDLRDALEKANVRWEQSMTEKARMGAEAVVRETAAKYKVRASKDAVLAERADIKDKLKRLGVRVNIGGLDPEEGYLVGRLGISYIKEGMTNLKDVVKNVLQDVPDIDERDVWQALNSKNPNAAARTNIQLAIRDIKREAKLLDTIEGIAEGELLEPVSKMVNPPYPDAVRALENAVSELKTAYGRREFNPQRLKSVYDKIDRTKEQIVGQFRAVKAKPDQAPLPSEFEGAKKQLSNLRKELGLTDKLAVLKEQARKGEIPVKRTIVHSPESMEVQRLRHEVKRQQARIQSAIHEMRPKNAWNYVVSGMNTVRSLQTVADLGTTGRQNMMLSILRPRAAVKALGRSIRAGFSEEYALRLDDAMRAQPANFYREQAGLFMPEIDEVSLMPMEEHFQKSWVDKLGIVRASKRQFVTATNQLRAAAFDEILDVPTATSDEMRMWADFVNKASGRGDLSSLSRAANLLSVAFFAPRFTASRFQTFTALYKHRKSPLVRKMIAKELLTTVGVGMTALGLLSLHPDIEVSIDPRNPDFGKIKIGNVRYDLWGGYQQMARFVGQMVMLPTDAAGWTSDEPRKTFDPFKKIERFMEFKAAPAPAAIREYITGTDMVGQEVKEVSRFGVTVPPWAVTTFKLGLPLVARDIVESYNEDKAQAIPAGLAAFMGSSISAYHKKSSKRDAAWGAQGTEW